MGGIFSAIGSLVGGLFGNSAANKRQQEMLAWQERMDNTKIQRLQADAKAAGVHPLAAMGASLHSPSPVSVGGHPDFSDMGQNIGRAVDAGLSSDEKSDNYTKTVQALNVDRMETENKILKMNLANSAASVLNQAGNPPTYGKLEGTTLGVTPDANHPKDSLRMFGFDIPRNGLFSDTENFTKRYGEMADYIAGPLVALGDAYGVLDKYYVPYAFRQASRWRGRNEARALEGERRYNDRRGNRRTDYSYW